MDFGEADVDGGRNWKPGKETVRARRRSMCGGDGGQNWKEGRETVRGEDQRPGGNGAHAGDRQLGGNGARGNGREGETAPLTGGSAIISRGRVRRLRSSNLATIDGSLVSASDS